MNGWPVEVCGAREGCAICSCLPGGRQDLRLVESRPGGKFHLQGSRKGRIAAFAVEISLWPPQQELTRTMGSVVLRWLICQLRPAFR